MVPVFVLDQRSESSCRLHWLADFIVVAKFRSAERDRKIRVVYTVSFLSFLECLKEEEWSSKLLDLAAILCVLSILISFPMLLSARRE